MSHVYLVFSAVSSRFGAAATAVGRRLGLALALGLPAAIGAHAQTASSYALTGSSAPYVPVVGGTLVSSIRADDAVSGALSIGFSFLFEGTPYTTFQVSSNGIMGLGTSTLTADFTNTLSTPPGQLPLLAPLFDDLAGSIPGNMAASRQFPTYQTTGTAPYRVLTMEWANWTSANNRSGDDLSFQVKLFETTGKIQFLYQQHSPVVANFSTTIGLKGKTGSFLSLLSANGSPATSTTTSTDNLPLPATNQVYTFSAPLATWTGAQNTDWGTAANWSPAQVPTATTDVLIPPVQRQPIVAGNQTCRALMLQDGSTALALGNVNGTPAQLTAAGNVSLGNGAIFYQQAGTKLLINGDLINNGTALTLDLTSTIAFDGAPATHNVYTSAIVRFENLSVGETTTASTLTLRGPAQVHRLLSIGTNGVVDVSNSGGTLRLLSDAVASAQVYDESNAHINGTVTVERYLAPNGTTGASYRHLACPTRGGTSLAFGTAAGFTPVYNSAFDTSPTPGLVTPFPNVFTYNAASIAGKTSNYSDFDKGWNSGVASTTLVLGAGYCLNVAAPTTFTFSGNLFSQGSNTSGYTRDNNPNGGWAFLGNSIMATLDASLLDNGCTNMELATYVFQSTGPYTGAYQSYVNGVGQARYLGVGQGFFKRVAAPGLTGSVVILPYMRAATYTAANIYRPAAETRTLVQLEVVSAATRQRDAAYVYCEAGATAGFDAAFDASKLPSSGGNYIAFTSGAEPLSISGLPLLGAADVLLPLTVAVPATGTYTLEAAQLLNLPAGKTAYLRDLQTGAQIDLSATPVYTFSMNSAYQGARFELLITSNSLLAVAPATLSAQVALYPSPAHGTALLEVPAALRQVALSATLRNALGQEVRTFALPATTSAEARTLSLTDVAPGVYSLCLRTAQGIVSKRLVVE